MFSAEPCRPVCRLSDQSVDESSADAASTVGESLIKNRCPGVWQSCNSCSSRRSLLDLRAARPDAPFFLRDTTHLSCSLDLACLSLSFAPGFDGEVHAQCPAFLSGVALDLCQILTYRLTMSLHLFENATMRARMRALVGGHKRRSHRAPV